MTDTPLTLDLMRAAFQILLGRDAESEAHAWESAKHYKTVKALREQFAVYPEVRRSVFAMLSDQIPFDIIKIRSKRGFDILINLKDTGVSKEIFLFDEFEPHNEAFITAHLVPGETFVDIGANIGWFSLIAAQRGAGQVLAFEANRRTCKMLTESVQMSPWRDLIEIYNVALAPSAGVLNYEDIQSGNIGGGQVHQTDYRHTQNADIIADKYAATADAFGDAPMAAVPAASLDSLLADYEGKIGLVKMDVEGSEPYVLRGAAQTLARHRPKLLIEFHKDKLEFSGDCSIAQLTAQLSDFGYDLYDFQSDKNTKLTGNDALYIVNNAGYYDFMALPR